MRRWTAWLWMSTAVGRSTATATASSSLATGVRNGERRSLAKAITLVESTTPAHSAATAQLLRELKHMQRGEGATPLSPRIAISGSPGAGKSCFIEALGTYLTDQVKKRVAVMAVDPSSSLSGGSLLGDKTRMTALSVNPNAFVRPSPSGGHLGGVTARCWEVLELFEAAHYDVTLIETVGVGQSETEVRNVADVFVLLVPPAAGDDLQAVKKGIVEVSDIIGVTKYDGERKKLAQETMLAYRRGLQMDVRLRLPEDMRLMPDTAFDEEVLLPTDPLLEPLTGDRSSLQGKEHEKEQLAELLTKMGICPSTIGSGRPIVLVSSELKVGIAEAWQEILRVFRRRQKYGVIDALRRRQRQQHFEQYFEAEMLHRGRTKLMAVTAAEGDPRSSTTRPSVSVPPGVTPLPTGGPSLWTALRDRVGANELSPREGADIALEYLNLLPGVTLTSR